MNAVSFDCCGGCVPLGPGQPVQDVIDIHAMQCEERERLNFIAGHRDEMYRDMATCWDLNARWLNTESEPNYPVEGCGDALARLRKAAS